MNSYKPLIFRASQQGKQPASSRFGGRAASTSASVAAHSASARGHCFGSISVLPPETVQRDDDDPPAAQPDDAQQAANQGTAADTPTSADTGTLSSAATGADSTLGDGTTDTGIAPVGMTGDDSDSSGGATPLAGGGDSGSTNIQAPTMQSNVIHGATLADVDSALGEEAGAVDFNIHLGKTQGDPLTSAIVNVTQTMTLPRWAERDKQCAPVKASWDTFLSALRNHENGHVTIDNQQCANLHQQYVGVAVADTQTKTDALTATVKKAGDDYDDGNHHGKTQTPPTTLDTSITCPAAGGGGS